MRSTTSRPTTGYGCWTRRRCTPPTCRARRTFWPPPAVIDVARVIHTSTVGALGVPKGAPGTEDTPVTLDGHGRSLQTLQVPGRAGRSWPPRARGLPVVVVNPSTPIGALDYKPTPTGRVILDFLNRRMPAYHRYRTQPGRRGRLRARASAGRRARQRSAKNTSWAEKTSPCSSYWSALPRFPACRRRESKFPTASRWDSRWVRI